MINPVVIAASQPGGRSTNPILRKYLPHTSTNCDFSASLNLKSSPNNLTQTISTVHTRELGSTCSASVSGVAYGIFGVTRCVTVLFRLTGFSACSSLPGENSVGVSGIFIFRGLPRPRFTGIGSFFVAPDPASECSSSVVGVCTGVISCAGLPASSGNSGTPL